MNNQTFYKPGDSIFHRCDSRTKLAIIVGVTLLSFLFFNPVVPAVLSIVVFIFNFISTGRYAFTNSLTKLFIVTIFLLVLIHGFANPIGKTPALFFGHEFTIPFFGTFSLEGAYFGLTYGFRVTAIALVSLLYISTTHPTEIVKGFTKLGVPYNIGFMILMSLQLIPISSREAQIIISAQKARGLVERTIWDKIKGLVPLFVPLVVISMERMETMAMALEARAFGSSSKPTPLYKVNFSAKDFVIVIFFLVISVAAVVLRVKCGGLNWIGNMHGWSNLFLPAIRG
ncbi:MAG: energy-coupling factor transporter transmembrane component T [Bacillota bacterium]|nr:energy-coupling factor transporter transmembrane component T [Bacillota bacterium]